MKRPRMAAELISSIGGEFVGKYAYDMLDMPDSPLDVKTNSYGQTVSGKHVSRKK